MNPAKNVYQLLMDMIKHEQNFGAYWIYLALKKGYLQKHDPVDKIHNVQFTQKDIEKIHAMDAQDVLGINRIKLYATLLDDNTYAFYFAENPGDAQRMHDSQFGVRAMKWHSIYNQHQYTTVFLPDTEESIYIFELKKRVKVFPFFVGIWGSG